MNVFLICLIASFMAWSVSKLSETHTDVTSYALNFTSVPDSLILNEVSRSQLTLRLRASGFQFLRMNFSQQTLGINLREVRKGASGYYLPRQALLTQIQQQLPGNMELLEVDADTLYVDFRQLHTKKVAVVADVTLGLGQNHLLEGGLQLSPDSITLSGPDIEIDTIEQVYTQPLVLNNLTEDFSVVTTLKQPQNQGQISYSKTTVEVSGKVFRFSEMILDVPVEVVNLPEGTQIKTFPAVIPVLCKARIAQLKDLVASDFRVVADYGSLPQGQSVLQLQLAQKPDAVHTAQLLVDGVEFILKRE